MKILAIETSCDETAIAILSVKGLLKKKFSVEAHQVASQIELHRKYGGVFPMMAKREHSRNIIPLFLETLTEAGLLGSLVSKSPWKLNFQVKITKMLEREPEMLVQFLEEIPKIDRPNIDRIAVTVGPGLEPALWVGINFAKALSLAWKIPLVPVNHMEGHVLSVLIPKNEKEFTLTKGSFRLPALSLLVSGGHTEIVLMKKIGAYAVVGQTRDDAAGEAFDKVARMMELPYPGGPEISRLAEHARSTGVTASFAFPRPMLGSGDFDFSFSGLKTSVLYHLRDMKKSGEELTENAKGEIALAFEDAVIDVLVKKTMAAAKKYGAKSIIAGGGVSANKHLAETLTAAARQLDIAAIFPAKELTTDNAIMIGLAGYFGTSVPLDSQKLTARGTMPL